MICLRDLYKKTNALLYIPKRRVKREPIEKNQKQSKDANSEKGKRIIYKRNYLFFNRREQDFIDQLWACYQAAISSNTLKNSNTVLKEDFEIGEFFIISFKSNAVLQ